MTQFSKLAANLKPSEIVKLGNEISQQIANGAHIFNYTIGDYSSKQFAIPKELQDAIVQAYRDGYTNYPPATGLKELLSAVAAFIQREEGISYNTDEVQIASGGRPLIYTLFQTLVNPGDKVVYSVPSWNNNHYTNLVGGTHCVVATTADHDFMPTAGELIPHLQDAVLLCLCSPLNPTGTTISREEMHKICDAVLAENERRGPDGRKLYLMYDQMYFTLPFGDTKHYTPVAERPAMKAYTILIDGVSKAFASTGLRVGWACGPAEVLAKMRGFLSHIGAWAPMPEQKGVADFLQNHKAVAAYLAQLKAGLYERLSYIAQHISSLKGEGYPVDCIAPQAAIYLTLKIDLVGRSYKGTKIADQQAVTLLLLKEAGLALVPFSCFGASADSPWYRWSVGTSSMQELAVALDQLAKLLQQLQ